MDTPQTARERSRHIIRSQQVRDRSPCNTRREKMYPMRSSCTNGISGGPLPGIGMRSRNSSVK
jgi:hypothetical protein